MADNVKHLNRETWLEAGIILLIDRVFEDLGKVDPAKFAEIPYRVACGFPVGSRGGKTVALGQTFNKLISDDHTVEVVVNAVMDQPMDVLPVLAHELVHVLVGLECGHRGAFSSTHVKSKAFEISRSYAHPARFIPMARRAHRTA